MDDGEVDFSNQEMFLGTNVSSGSMDSFFDEIFGDTHACTHTHTCNPPGPDSSHTHTCYHVHTKIFPASMSDDTSESLDKQEGKKRPNGNREAVRKYREKKKARAASLEDEVVRLRALNQQLMKRIQSQVGLEAEVGRLKCLLVDIRGRIDGEIGSFPYQKQQKQHRASQSHVNPDFMLNPCNMMQHDPDLNGCDFQDLQCLANHNSELDDGFVDVNPSAGTKRRGTRAATSR